MANLDLRDPELGPNHDPILRPGSSNNRLPRQRSWLRRSEGTRRHFSHTFAFLIDH